MSDDTKITKEVESWENVNKNQTKLTDKSLLALAKTGVIDIKDLGLDSLGKIPCADKIPALNYLKPIKFTRETNPIIIANLLFATPEEVASLYKEITTPIWWKIIISIIVSALKGNTQSIQWLVKEGGFEQPDKAFISETLNSLGPSSVTREQAVLVLPDPETFNEEKVIERQKKLSSVTVERYKELAKESQDE